MGKGVIRRPTPQHPEEIVCGHIWDMVYDLHILALMAKQYPDAPPGIHTAQVKLCEFGNEWIKYTDAKYPYVSPYADEDGM
jgi:hypothetical protein